jgi:CRISPR type IV-associated protein Csf3
LEIVIFIPLKITINLENSFCKLSDMPFDSILAKLYFQEQINNKTFNGDYEQPLPFLKMSDGIYHTSKPFYNVKYIFTDTICKHFDFLTYASLGGDTTHHKTLQNKKSGRYKNHVIKYELISTDYIIYYINGDFNMICSLLSKLNYIGKKCSLGWGKISNIDICECDEDYSLYKNGIASRHLPNIKNYNSKYMAKVNMPLMPPYWKQSEDISLIDIRSIND